MEASMETKKRQQDTGQALFVGIDLHRKNWHVTVRTTESELFHGTIPGRWDALHALLSRYRRAVLHVVYEAGYFGYWLHDRLVAIGATCVVTPPSLIPQEAGNRVKTDRKDSRKLALLLAKGLLKQVWVPDEEGRMHRQVIRRRRQLIGDRVRT
jgi:transposase